MSLCTHPSVLLSTPDLRMLSIIQWYLTKGRHPGIPGHHKSENHLEGIEPTELNGSNMSDRASNFYQGNRCRKAIQYLGLVAEGRRMRVLQIMKKTH